LHPGDWEYNEIHPWDYARIPDVLRGGKGYTVNTEGELDETLRAVWDDREEMSLLHVKLPTGDQSETLRRLAVRLSERI
jgi:indolepyruvate decarboxylase